MLQQLAKLVWRTFVVLGVALSFFALLELIRAYETLRDLQPLLGTVFAYALLLGLIALLVYYRLTVYRWRSVLLPPPRQDLSTAGESALQGYARYLRRVMQRLSQNGALPEDRREQLKVAAKELLAYTAAKPDRDALAERLAEAESEAIDPAISQLDELADKEVRTSVRDVMLAVTLSPWRSVDLIVVIYRNVGMVSRVTQIYESRPRLREQFHILKDVGAIVATVNFLNYGSKLLQNLAQTVLPLLGRFTDDVAQGVGAGLLTSVAGHATIDRCRAFRGWNEAEAKETLRRKLKDFAADLKDLVTTDLFAKIRKPVEAQTPWGTSNTEAVSRVREGLATALDDTAAVMDTFVRRPVVAAGRGVVNTGSFVGGAVLRGGQAGVQGVAAAGKASGRFVGNVTVGTGKAVWRGTKVSADLTKRATVGAVKGTGRGVKAILTAPGRLFRRKPKNTGDDEP